MTTERDLGALRDHVLDGGSAAVLGVASLDVPRSWGRLLVRVPNARGVEPLWPVIEAWRAAQSILGGQQDNPPARMALRRRLLGELADGAGGDLLVGTWNRLHRETRGTAVLVFDSAEAMDEPSAVVLRRVLTGPSRLELPILLAFRSAPKGGAGGRLVEALRSAGGMVVSLDVPPPLHSISAWRSLPPGVVQILRACAVQGVDVDAAEVAEILGVGTLDVLEALQVAFDSGLPIEDLGAMHVRLAPELVRELETSTLPSLAAARREQPPTSRAAPPAAAGDEAIRGYLADARSAEARGAPVEALGAAGAALAALDRAPDSTDRRHLRARVLAEIGRIRWLGAGPGRGFSLTEALEALTEAARMLDADGPADLRAHVAGLIAGVCHDIGDPRSLERALAELAMAGRIAREAGQADEAAHFRLDEAAIHLLRGDTFRALRLAQASRAVFVARAPADPEALASLAEADHLLARIALHAPEQAEELEALRAALARAHGAEAAFLRLGDRRELGRVEETIGRLELRRGRLREALEQLQVAASTQLETGDAMGLARTTAAIAGALAAAGDARTALAVLADSVRLNAAKGSSLGLASNRRSLEALRAGGLPDVESDRLARDLAKQLDEPGSDSHALPHVFGPERAA